MTRRARRRNPTTLLRWARDQARTAANLPDIFSPFERSVAWWLDQFRRSRLWARRAGVRKTLRGHRWTVTVRGSLDVSLHLCHAHGCERAVRPSLLFCLPHWRGLRVEMQRRVWREYRAGQENDKRPSLRYLAVQRFAIAEVLHRDDEASAHQVLLYVVDACRFRVRSVVAGLGDPLENVGGPLGKMLERAGKDVGT